jgi:crossover junction endodeoxyribonuclease RusA
MTYFDLPWPHKDLSPNSRCHWSRKSRVTKAYRSTCHILCRASGIKAPAGRLLVSLEFIPPDRRNRDLDNLLTSCKALLDGVADALGVNDRQFVPQLMMSETTTKGGAVRVRISEYQG